MRSLHDSAGSNTSSASLAYSALLFPLPIATSVIGMTSMLFAVHGTLANVVLLHRAWRFYEEANDKNARALFKTSLWQLPLLTGLFAFHKLNDRQESAIAELDGVHEFGKRLCLHESLANSNVAKELCPNTADFVHTT
jgi:hypothetical protein